jgi:hypothetical protein
VLHGLGNAEEPEMTVAPWALPFSELRWGRTYRIRRGHRHVPVQIVG